MLSICLRSKALTRVYRSIVGWCLTLLTMPVFAQGSAQLPNVETVSAVTMLQTIAANLPNLMRLVTALAYVIGFVLVIQGIMKLKHAGEMRTQMSHEHHLTAPIALISAGALLIYLPSSVQSGMSTFWTNPNPYGYLDQTDQWSQFINLCFMVVQFIGTIAFIRGLIMLSHLGGGGGHQQGGFPKAMTHIVGGILCINIYQFMQVILNTLGISLS